MGRQGGGVFFEELDHTMFKEHDGDGVDGLLPERRADEKGNPEAWAKLYRADLVRFAYARLRDRHLAEDVVQETLAVALVAHQRYAGQSSERTWLVGILNHKISDVFRKRVWSPSASAECSEPQREREPQTDSDDEPERSAERALFREMIASCVAELPVRMQRAFILCDLEERDTRETAQALNVSIPNLWVMLHRARRRICLCLKDRVFGRAC